MGRRIQVDSGVCFLLAAWILLIPARWILAAMIAAAVHELSHILAVYLFGGNIQFARIGMGRILLRTSPLGRIEEAVCAFAGPFASLFLTVFGKWCPELAVCALAQGLFNLIPVYPLDGGRILRRLLTESWCAGIECFTGIILFGLSLAAYLSTELGLGCYFPAMLLGILWLRRKIPCKAAEIPLQ